MLNPHVRTMHKIDQEHKAHVTEGEQTIPPTLATPSHHGPSKALTKPTLRDQHNVMEEATFNPVRIHLEIDTREQTLMPWRTKCRVCIPRTLAVE